MNKNLLTILLMFCLLHTIYAQNRSDILIIDSKYDISISADKMMSEIIIPLGETHKTKKKLMQQCIDSTKFYNGNCFKVTYHGNTFVTVLRDNKVPEDQIRGKIYILTENEIQKIQKNIENYKLTKGDRIKTENSREDIDSSKVIYKGNFVFQYGGESQITTLPKLNILRIHTLNLLNPYYGIEAGCFPLFVAGAFSFSGIVGFEKNIFSLETSVSHFRTTKVSDGAGGLNGPYSQNLINLKLGFQVFKKVRLKIGTSYVLSKNMPLEHIDLGAINGNIYGIELQISMK